MKVSIITPSYNQGQFIERTLQSVLKQRSEDYELEYVVFDGGSSDETVQILEQYSQSVRWVSKPDKGQTNAVNMGIDATDGEIIGWLNSDDVYYSDAVSQVVKYFIEHPNVDVVYGKADHIDVNDLPIEAYPTEPWNFERLKDTCFICQPALFFRRSIVEANGLLDESLNYCMDYEYWLRLGINGVKFSYLGEKLAGSRLYADNKTLRSRVGVHKEINKVLIRLFHKVPDKWIYSYAHAIVLSKFDRKESPKLSVLFLCAVTLFSTFIWNKSISMEMRGNLIQWLKGVNWKK